MKTLRTLLLCSAMATPAMAQDDLTTVNVIQPIPLTTIVYAQIAALELGYFEEEGIEMNLLTNGGVKVSYKYGGGWQLANSADEILL